MRLDRLDQIRATQKRIEARLAVPEWPNVVTELRPWLKHIKLAQQQLGAAQSLSSLISGFRSSFEIGASTR